ncbi:MAG: hypothetical protein ACI837_001384, partial [Crocinitomicaceae bacterium]
MTLFSGILASCHTVKWNSLNSGEMETPPASITSIFSQYEDQTLELEANSPGFNYKYDIGEKDAFYGDSTSFSFKTVRIKLHNKTPAGKLISDISFLDGNANKVIIQDVDLLRLIPKFDAVGDMIYPEMIEEEYNRFGYTFRREHKEFSIELNDPQNEEMIAISDRAYRCQVVNNCLAPSKWEFALTSEDYGDFKDRLKDEQNLNQNKILSHSWFFLNEDLYAALVALKNPGLNLDLTMEYDTLSKLAENVRIDFESLRNPIKYRANAPLIELGYKSGRTIEPLDNEQFYKKEF